MHSLLFPGHRRTALVACVFAVVANAQSSFIPVEPAGIGKVASQTRLGFKTLVRDHALLWSSPFRSNKTLKVVLPLATATAISLALDHRIASALPDSRDQIRYSKAVSHAGAYYSLGAAAGAFVALGAVTHNDRAIRTGLLAAEAVAHTESIAQMLKYAGGRERPDYGNFNGRFWQGQQSFPSGHAMGTWAVATVISREYSDNRFIKYGVYALPVLVSASRITARRHFLSDVVAGGSIGYLMGSWLHDRHRGADLGRAFGNRVSIQPSFGVHPRWGGITAGLNVSRSAR